MQEPGQDSVWTQPRGLGPGSQSERWQGRKGHLINLHFTSIQSKEIGNLPKVTLEKTLLEPRPESLLPSSLDSELQLSAVRPEPVCVQAFVHISQILSDFTLPGCLVNTEETQDGTFRNSKRSAPNSGLIAHLASLMPADTGREWRPPAPPLG